MKEFIFVPLGGFVLAALAATPLMAEELRFDPEQTETCLAASGDSVQDCIGRASSACMAQPMGETTLGMGFCLDAELSLWDDKLNTVYQQLRSDYAAIDARRLEGAPAIADALRDMQRGWIGYRDARCGFAAAQWAGGTGATPAFLGCMMQMTAEQTLFLWSVVDDAR